MPHRRPRYCYPSLHILLSGASLAHDKREDLLSRNVLVNLSNSSGDYCKLPDMSAYHNARQNVIS